MFYGHSLFDHGYFIGYILEYSLLEYEQLDYMHSAGCHLGQVVATCKIYTFVDNHINCGKLLCCMCCNVICCFACQHYWDGFSLTFSNLLISYGLCTMKVLTVPMWYNYCEYFIYAGYCSNTKFSDYSQHIMKLINVYNNKNYTKATTYS